MQTQHAPGTGVVVNANGDLAMSPQHRPFIGQTHIVDRVFKNGLCTLRDQDQRIRFKKRNLSLIK